MKYKLIAVDIDGTLITTDKRLTERTKKAVKAVVEKGVIFMLATGRAAQGLELVKSQLPIDGMPAVAYNGAMVFDKDQIISSLAVEKDVARKVIDEGFKRNAYVIVWANNRLYARYHDKRMDFYKKISQVEPIYLDDLTALADEGITKVLWFDEEKNILSYLDEVQILVGDKINAVQSMPFFLEFFNKDCSKDRAIKLICQRYGIEKEETVAIGDGNNDLEMLLGAGLGVAMANASQFLKEKAKKVIASCDEDGVALFLEELLAENLV